MSSRQNALVVNAVLHISCGIIIIVVIVIFIIIIIIIIVIVIIIIVIIILSVVCLCRKFSQDCHCVFQGSGSCEMLVASVSSRMIYSTNAFKIGCEQVELPFSSNVVQRKMNICTEHYNSPSSAVRRDFVLVGQCGVFQVNTKKFILHKTVKS